MSIVSVFGRVLRGGQDGHIHASWGVRRRGAGAALSRLTFVALAIALAPGLTGELAHARVSPPPGVTSAGGLNFSDPPQDDEFLRAGVLAQPLVPAGQRATSAQENRDLAAALRSYARRGHERDEVAPLLAFLDKHPASAWRASLEVNVGAAYRVTGHFSKALAIWQTAWDEAKGYQDARGREVGDAAAGYLSQMEAYLGRKETLGPLLDEIKKRPVRGSAQELVENSAEGLAGMIQSPGVSFLCGPHALSRILQLERSPEASKGMAALADAHSTPEGLSLSAVERESIDAGMNYQMAFRSSGAPIVVPSVAHWKTGHFAAVLREEPHEHYLVGDLTFGRDLVVSRPTMDDEASGYFLVPPGPLPDGWRPVDAQEGDGVWGRGYTGDNHDAGASGRDEIHAFPCSGNGPCTTWNVEASIVSLSMHDDPVGYTPPVGPAIRFPLDYSHRDSLQPTPFYYTNFGNKWTFDWVSFLTIGCDNEYGQSTLSYVGGGSGSPAFPVWTQTPVCVSLYRRGGGEEQYFFQSVSSGQPETSTVGAFSQAYLTLLNPKSDGTFDGFQRFLPDGSVETFSQASGTFGTAEGGDGGDAGSVFSFPQFFLSSFSDPQGNCAFGVNCVTLSYDVPTMRITGITDALGQTSTVCYNDSYLTAGSPCLQPVATAPASSQCTQLPPATAPDCTTFKDCNLLVTQVVDPFGRSAFFGYGQGNHLVSITDVLGITSTYHYQVDNTTTPPSPTDFIDSLTTPYGCTTFSFTGSLTTDTTANTAGERSVTTTDPLGRTSYVEYVQGGYGQYGGDCGAANAVPGDQWNSSWESGSYIPCTPADIPQLPQQVQAQGPFIGGPLGISPLSNQDVQYRNTFVWDPYQYSAACPVVMATNLPCYPNAKVFHWLHTNQIGAVNAANPLTASRVPETIRPPRESRIWFEYPGQYNNTIIEGKKTEQVGSMNKPIIVARLITDGSGQTSQTWMYQYNSYGSTTQVTDPVGRQLTLAYPFSGPGTGIDLQTVTNTTTTNTGQVNDVLLTLGTYVNHRPLSWTGANGQTTNLIYNDSGQVETVTDPLGNVWNYCYSPSGQSQSCEQKQRHQGHERGSGNSPGGYLRTITGPVVVPNGASDYSFAYDTMGRVASSTDPTGETIQYQYDAADRLALATFLDNTTVQLGYTNLDLTSVTDRAGYTTIRTYDADRELGATPPACSGGATPSCCASQSCSFPAGVSPGINEPNGRTTVLSYWGNKTLQSMRDPDGNLTNFQTDLDGRITTMAYANGTTRTYGFDDGGRLVNVNPAAAGGIMLYSYYADDTVATVGFSEHIGDLTGFLITYCYDGAYKRLTSWSKSSGASQLA